MFVRFAPRRGRAGLGDAALVLQEYAAEHASRFGHTPYIAGRCNVCGNATVFFCENRAVARESLACAECRTTSRYRSLARGLLRAVRELAGVAAKSLAELAEARPGRRLKVYDTQIPFQYRTTAYPLPDLLRLCPWIDVELSRFVPGEPWGKALGGGVSNQTLEQLTYPDGAFDVVITSDVMEHVRLDERAHREIARVVRPGGVYLFTVPHFRDRESTLVRVEVADPDDPSQDRFLTEPEYHGDANSADGKALSYRSYGTGIDGFLGALGFDVEYTKEDVPANAILNTELFYCRRR
jgi:O-antigen biosynthesis protein